MGSLTKNAYAGQSSGSHFPDLVPLGKQQTAQATNSQQLQEILGNLFVAHTDNEAKAALLGEQ